MNQFIFITRDGAPLAIADRLRDEGKDVVVAFVTDKECDRWSKEKLACRNQLYEGILDYFEAEDVLKWMADLKDKGEWFVMFDYGDLCPYSQRALDMGFTKGVFPTEAGYELECDRRKGKAFAKQHYPALKVAEVHEFKKAEEAIKFLDTQQDKIFVLKSEGSNAETVVPLTDDPELARLQVLGALKTETKGYEKEGFTLEEKIRNAIEISPVMVFWEGKPLFSLVELENKSLGSGVVGRLTGGAQNLTLQTPLDCALNKMAFPPIVFEMAKKQPGIGIYDAGMLYDGRQFFFTEFCGQRWGWDGIFSEIAMCGDENGKGAASRHFDLICQGTSPIRFPFGASVRLFQTKPDGKRPDVYADGYACNWLDEVSERLYFYCIRKEEAEVMENGQFVSVGFDKDFAVATGAGATMKEAVDRAYQAAEGVAMTGVYYRPKFDFLSKAYFSSILNRWDFLGESGLLARESSVRQA